MWRVNGRRFMLSTELGGYKTGERSIISQQTDEASNVDIHGNEIRASLCRAGRGRCRHYLHSFEAAPTLAASRFEGDAPKARARPESAATVITGREAWMVRECAVDVPGPVGGDECVRAWFTRSLREARSSRCPSKVACGKILV